MLALLTAARKPEEGDWSGRGESPGNDFFITLGGMEFWTETPIDRNVLSNYQALTVMHELGHNLGLSHGGFNRYEGGAVADEANWKPNYFSVMNYLYTVGLPALDGDEGDRYYYEHSEANPGCAAKGVSLCSMSRSVCGDPALLGLDFSRGQGGSIDVSHVVESDGLRQPGSSAVDFDCDGTIDAEDYASTLYAAVEDEDVSLSTLRDHDDWGALDLFFPVTRGGANDAIYGPAARDVQPLAPVDPVPSALLLWLRSR